MTCVNPVYTYMTTTHKIVFKKNFTPPPRGMFQTFSKNSVYEESCVLVFLNFYRKNYNHIISGLFRNLVFVPFFWWFW